MDGHDDQAPTANVGYFRLRVVGGDGIRRGFPPWGLSECVVGLGAAIVGLVSISAMLALTAPRGPAHTVQRDMIALIATLVFEALLFGIAVGMTAGKFGGGLGVLGWRPRAPESWLGWSFLALFLAWLTLGVYYAITSLLGLHDFTPKSNVPTGIFDHRQTVVLAVILTVVVAPVCEESFFRGFMFNGLRRTLGFSGAATVSGVLFAVAHASASLIIPFTVVGVIFAYAYRRTGTLWTSVTTHFLFNLASVLVALNSK